MGRFGYCPALWHPSDARGICRLDIREKRRSLYPILPLIHDRVLEVPADRQVQQILGLLFTICLLAVIKAGRDRFAIDSVVTRLLEGEAFHQEGGIGKDSILSRCWIVCCGNPETSVRDSNDQPRSISLLGPLIFCELRYRRLL